MQKFSFSVFCLALLCSYASLQAQTRVTCTGGYIVALGANSNLVLKDAFLSFPAQTLPAVTGNFIPSSGKVKMTGTGTSAQAFIRMDDTLNSSLFNLVIDKSLNNAKLVSNVKIKKSITLTNGGLELNVRKAIMNNPSDALLVGESETRRVFGTTGYVERTKVLNAPVSDNMSNMGAIITSAANLGNTTVRRGNNVNTLPTGASVQRLYRIKKAGAATATLTLRFSYFDAELNGNNESTMVLWRKIGAGAWTQLGATARDGAANWVEFNALTLTSTQESFITLGPPTIALIGQESDGINGEVVESNVENAHISVSIGDWMAYPNPTTSKVQLAINAPTDADVTLELYDLDGRLVKAENVQLYEGENNITADLDGFAAGTYVVSCKGLALTPIRVVKLAN